MNNAAMLHTLPFLWLCCLFSASQTSSSPGPNLPNSNMQPKPTPPSRQLISGECDDSAVASWYSEEPCAIKLQSESCLVQEYGISRCWRGKCSADDSVQCHSYMTSKTLDILVDKKCCSGAQVYADLTSSYIYGGYNDDNFIVEFDKTVNSNITRCEKAMLCQKIYGGRPNPCPNFIDKAKDLVIESTLEHDHDEDEIYFLHSVFWQMYCARWKMDHDYTCVNDDCDPSQDPMSTSPLEDEQEYEQEDEQDDAKEWEATPFYGGVSEKGSENENEPMSKTILSPQVLIISIAVIMLCVALAIKGNSLEEKVRHTFTRFNPFEGGKISNSAAAIYTES